MSSKERVLASFEHREPDRVSLWYGASEGLTSKLIERCRVVDEGGLMRRLHIDFRRVRERYIGFSGLREQYEKWSEYAIIGGPWVVVFTDAMELVGMSEFFIKMYTHPDVMRAVIQKVSDFYYELATRFFEEVGDLLDIFFFGDDMGTQEGLMISRSLALLLSPSRLSLCGVG